ncbi:hypothetical protein ENBRE01_2952 [Enteropsectra breve]|nr:hypothetical protein ENBRE01_2952 [Enteropsectra breve]
MQVRENDLHSWKGIAKFYAPCKNEIDPTAIVEACLKAQTTNIWDFIDEFYSELEKFGVKSRTILKFLAFRIKKSEKEMLELENSFDLEMFKELQKFYLWKDKKNHRLTANRKITIKKFGTGMLQMM